MSPAVVRRQRPASCATALIGRRLGSATIDVGAIWPQHATVPSAWRTQVLSAAAESSTASWMPATGAGCARSPGVLVPSWRFAFEPQHDTV